MPRRTISTTLAIGTVAIGLSTIRPVAQQTQDSPIFRSRVQLIELDVRVTDRNGTPVRDLQKEDFIVLEDGVPQTIATSSFVDLGIESPVTQIPVTTPESDVATNAGSGRMWVMLLGGVGEKARIAARTFVEQALGHRWRFLLRDFEAGDYILTVESRAGRHAVNRSVLFRVVDR